MLAGSPFSHEIEFSTGLPTGAVTYSVLGNDNLPLVGYDGLTVTPAVGAVSLLLIVPGAANTCANPLFEARTLTWSYTTANGVVTNRVRYRVEKDVPFPVSQDGVRAKLGVEPHEVEDKDIDLLMAYAQLASQYDTGALDAYAANGDYNTLLVTHAIEAVAALRVFPSLQLAVAKSEDSGTNKYERFTAVDWEALRTSLESYIFDVNNLIGIDDDTFVGVLIFSKVGLTNDPLTGSEYVSV